ncbi:hypothetical protein CEK26_007621 [Fusarium fujikuroi]|nr:hypothetical protein CEK27_007641 [Fusarium fujikuroi]QGI94552.1 hypothetical protein CEK26_007621 [Fusarium fujikuroi]VZH94782.1 unnamed protein product [Fusarium fujikuroi]
MEDLCSVERAGVALGQKTLFTTRNDEKVFLSKGYIPLLVNLTIEDKAAKGLRKHKGGNTRQDAVYVSALEAVRDNRFLLLTGQSGSGKTTFAEYLIFGHTTGVFEKDRDAIPRNESGERRKEILSGLRTLPLLVTVANTQDLADVDDNLRAILESWDSREKERAYDELLLILDGTEKAGSQGMKHIASIANAITPRPHVRLLVLGRDEETQDWTLPVGIAKLQILPLLTTQRYELARKLNLDTDYGSGNGASRPAVFTLSLAAGHVGDTGECALDAWLTVLNPEALQDLLHGALDEWEHQRHGQLNSLTKTTQKWPFVLCTAVQELLVAAQLQTASFQEILDVFDQDAKSAIPIIRSLLNRFAKGEKQEKLICELLNRHEYDLDEEQAQYAALVASEFIDLNNTPLVTQAIARLLKVVEIGTLPLSYRVMAGRYLSLFGDPRDLTELVAVTEGTSLFGSSNHPNSRPVHRLHIGPFKIGAFPVVNQDYGEFVQQTGRTWLSQDGYDPYSRNTPATDLTWHDARAYCQWVTQKWRKEGKIGPNETVRLPSEPQWERASRGDQREPQAGQNVYPWGTNFATSLSNCEELALNNKCTVGLFPQSRSPFGCYDMTGQDTSLYQHIAETMPILNDVQLSSPKDLVSLARGDEPIYVILTSSNDEETGAPWCSDVRAALPFLKETFGKPDGPKAVYESVGPRPGWKKPDNPHKLTWNISAIPTVIRFELRDGRIEETGRLVEAEVYEEGRLQNFVLKSV